MTDLEIFINAPNDLTDVELSVYFDEACGDDEALRAGVETLVAATRKSPTFLEHSAVRGADPAGTDSATDREQPGTVIDRYRLIEKIGEGGFGADLYAMSLNYTANTHFHQPSQCRSNLYGISYGFF